MEYSLPRRSHWSCVVGAVGNVIVDVQHTTTAANLSYWYIITDADDNILEWQNSQAGNTLDLSGAPAGECHIWGWSYQGLPDPIVGDNINSLSDDGCEDISANFITVIREVPEGGTVSLPDGSTTVTAVAGDVIIDVVHETTANNLSYWYIITDADDNILEWQNSADGSTLDLSAAPAGECHIWGWSYAGLDDPIVGEHISTLSDDIAEDISDNWITVIRSGITATEDEVFSQLSIYPNPATNHLNIDLQARDGNATGYVVLVNTIGKAVTTQVIQADQRSIVFDVSQIPSGTYFINLSLDNNSFSKRVLVIH